MGYCDGLVMLAGGMEGGGEGAVDSHVKKLGMLVFSLRGINQGCWSHLGCW